MRKITLLAFVLAVTCPLARGQMKEQRACERIVHNSIELTRTERPDVYSTIDGYLYGYSARRQSCVIVVRYRTSGARVQIKAVNAITMQPMSGSKDIFLVPEKETAEIQNATDYLFDKYVNN